MKVKPVKKSKSMTDGKETPPTLTEERHEEALQIMVKAAEQAAREVRMQIIAEGWELRLEELRNKDPRTLTVRESIALTELVRKKWREKELNGTLTPEEKSWLETTKKLDEDWYNEGAIVRAEVRAKAEAEGRPEF